MNQSEGINCLLWLEQAAPKLKRNIPTQLETQCQPPERELVRVQFASNWSVSKRDPTSSVSEALPLPSVRRIPLINYLPSPPYLANKHGFIGASPKVVAFAFRARCLSQESCCWYPWTVIAGFSWLDPATAETPTTPLIPLD